MDGFSLLIGLIIGLAAGLAVAWWRVRDVQNLHRQAMKEKADETATMMASMKESFGALSLEALSKNTDEFLKMASEKLGKHTETNSQAMEGKKALIDQTLKGMKGELEKVNTMVQTIEKDRKAKFDVLSKELTRAADETKELRETTQTLKAALANTKVRGQWGERMAEDVLRLAGFIEGTNYLKQAHLENSDGTSRPDYTFYMPQNRVVHMDVKFPLDNYLQFLEAESELEQENFKTQFLKDTRLRVKEVTKRSYIDQDTLDYVLVFIPNEQVYAFINEHDRDLLDYAMQNKVILCSPMTLYAILSVIRQAVDNFHLERTASEILGLLSTFNQQWDKFCEAMDSLGKRMESSNKAFEELTGPRRRQLEKPLQKIEALRDNERLVDGPGGSKLKIIENLGVVSEEKH